MFGEWLWSLVRLNVVLHSVVRLCILGGEFILDLYLWFPSACRSLLFLFIFMPGFYFFHCLDVCNMINWIIRYQYTIKAQPFQFGWEFKPSQTTTFHSIHSLAKLTYLRIDPVTFDFLKNPRIFCDLKMEKKIFEACTGAQVPL